MSNPYTVDALLLPTIRRRGMLPNTSETLANADYLAMANDELQSFIVPLLLRVREEYLVTVKDITIVANTDTYPIPTRAVGGKVRDVQISDSSTTASFRQLARLEPERTGDYISSGGVMGYRFEGNNIVLTPAPSSSGTLRIKYHMVPNRLVLLAACGDVTSVASIASKQLTIANYPTGTFVTGATSYDIVKGTPGFDTYEIDNSATRSSGVLTFTDSLDTNIAVGDYVCLAGESCIPQIPLCLHPLLAQRVVLRALEALGDPKASVAQKTCDELTKSAVTLLSPRSDGNSRPVINRYGPGFAQRAFGRWRRRL